jgi:hypothetical protein
VQRRLAPPPLRPHRSDRLRYVRPSHKSHVRWLTRPSRRADVLRTFRRSPVRARNLEDEQLARSAVQARTARLPSRRRVTRGMFAFGSEPNEFSPIAGAGAVGSGLRHDASDAATRLPAARLASRRRQHPGRRSPTIRHSTTAPFARSPSGSSSASCGVTGSSPVTRTRTTVDSFRDDLASEDVRVEGARGRRCARSETALRECLRRAPAGSRSRCSAAGRSRLRSSVTWTRADAEYSARRPDPIPGRVGAPS